MYPVQPKSHFYKTLATQSAVMAGCAVGIIPALAITPLTLVLRNAREKLPVEKQETHPLAKAHDFLGSAVFFCAANLIQGPGMIVGAYKRSYGTKAKGRF